jgi:hypothetical protein
MAAVDVALSHELARAVEVVGEGGVDELILRRTPALNDARHARGRSNARREGTSGGSLR